MAEPAADTGAALVVQLTGVRKAYNVGRPFETEVLHGIDLTVRRGEFCAVMGPSGSGKSTLLNLVGLLDRPTAGTLRVCGEDTTVLDDRALTRLRGHSIGFVFQHHHLITAFTAIENVMMPMLGAAGFPDAAMRTRAAALIDSVGLSAWQDHLAGQLSGGQQQRVAVARALAMDPALLLADEPTGNLDRATGDEVVRLLEELNARGVTLIVVTHDASLGARARRRLMMEDGQLRRDERTPA